MTQEQKNMVLERRKSAKHARKRAEGLWWAGALIWAGLVFGTNSMGYLPQIGSADVWSWVFIGAGLYGIMLNLYNSFLPDSVTTTWDYIWSGFWLLLGLSGLFAIDMFWPLVLVLIGGVTLSKAIGSS